jgi:hypothetical protein
MIQARKTIQHRINQRITKKHIKRGGATLSIQQLSNVTRKANLLLEKKENDVIRIKEKLKNIELQSKEASLEKSDKAKGQLEKVKEELKRAEEAQKEALKNAEAAAAAEIAKSSDVSYINEDIGGGGGGARIVQSKSKLSLLANAKKQPVISSSEKEGKEIKVQRILRPLVQSSKNSSSEKEGKEIKVQKILRPLVQSSKNSSSKIRPRESGTNELKPKIKLNIKTPTKEDIKESIVELGLTLTTEELNRIEEVYIESYDYKIQDILKRLNEIFEGLVSIYSLQEENRTNPNIIKIIRHTLLKQVKKELKKIIKDEIP